MASGLAGAGAAGGGALGAGPLVALLVPVAPDEQAASATGTAAAASSAAADERRCLSGMITSGSVVVRRVPAGLARCESPARI